MMIMRFRFRASVRSIILGRFSNTRFSESPEFKKKFNKDTFKLQI